MTAEAGDLRGRAVPRTRPGKPGGNGAGSPASYFKPNAFLTAMFDTSSRLIIPGDTAGAKLHASTNADKSISSERRFRDEKHPVGFVWSGL